MRLSGTNPISTSPDTTIVEAARVMLEHKISGLPVVDNRGNVVGIITEPDIFRLVVKEWSKFM
ncbi:MAG: CBS domain-containing protein [Anaerolineae bacterium]|nr:CBS domain-containing protein [Anaerolineae bacterium]